MMMTIMRVFGAYDVHKLMNTPICHILKLNILASKAVRLSQYDVMAGYLAAKDRGMCTELQRVADSAIIIDKEAVASIFTQEAVAEAQRRYENYEKSLSKA